MTEYVLPGRRTYMYMALHPLIICTLTVGALAYFGDDFFPLGQLGLFVGVFLATFAVPIYFVYRFVRRRFDPERVVQILAVAGVILVAPLLIVTYIYDAPPGFVLCGYIGLVNGLAVVSINRFTSMAISPHATILSGSAITALLLAPQVALVIYPLCVLSAWVIWQTEHSTLQDIAQTWVIVSLCSILVFNIYLIF